MLPPRLAAPRGRWPAVRVDVLTGSCDEIRERVATGESNLGLVLEPETGPKAGAALARARLLILGAPTHPLTRGVAAAKDLGRGDFCMCDAEGHCHQVLRLHFEAIGAPAPHLQAMGTIEGCEGCPSTASTRNWATACSPRCASVQRYRPWWCAPCSRPAVTGGLEDLIEASRG